MRLTRACMYLSLLSTEGVFYRIKQRLQQYNMEPVSVQVKEHIASSKVSLLDALTFWQYYISKRQALARQVYVLYVHV